MCFGDFNLSSLVWAHDLESSAMVPSNLHPPHEILVIDELLSMGLVQINHVFNNLNKLLDLIFVHPDLCLTLFCSDNPLVACDAHHKPLLILITCYIFSPNNSRLPLTYINSSSLYSIRSDTSNIRWAEVLSHADVNTTYAVFISFLSAIIGRYAKTRVQSSYRVLIYM